MGKNSLIEHKGIVTEISDNSVFVELTVMSACSSCHAKSICGLDSTHKTVEITNPNGVWQIGEDVNVIMRESLGTRALMLGYILPFFVLIISLIVFILLGLSEGLSGILSLGMLFPYYLALYFGKNKIKRDFKFNLEKI
ncbi:MAG TPA: SoxR reducing system RseC family protein [Bacteroidales bacterium]|nr:SoxR reducing system RseC family protein [Bacteroidales bacterium]